MKRLRAFLPLIVLLAIGVGLFFSGALDRFAPSEIGAQQQNLREMVATYPLLSRLAQVVIVMLGISTGIPGVIVLIFAGGLLFGIIEGTILSGVGTTLGATILFLVSRSAFSQGGAAPLLVEKLRSGYHAFPFSYTLFLRLMPLFPFGGVTIALAWLRCPLWLFLSATAAGGTVMIAFETALGAGLADTLARQGAVSLDLFSHKRVLLPLAGMAVLSLTPIVLGQLRRLGRGGRKGAGADVVAVETAESLERD